MSWRNVKLIFLREVRDQLRDRRTLFMIAVLPLLLYPSLGIGMMQMTLMFAEQPRTVVILGADNLPSKPQLLDGDHIAEGYFRTASSAKKLKIVTDLPLEQETGEKKSGAAGSGGDKKWSAERKALIEQSQAIRQLAEKKRETTNKAELAELNREIGRLMSSSRLRVLVIIPDGFAKNIEKANRKFSARMAAGKPLASPDSDAEPDDYRRPEIIWNKADEKSQIAYARVKEALDNWEQAIFHERLAAANLPTDFSAPVGAVTVDVAEASELSANLWSKLFPALLVIMAVTGAFYPAVDLAAGEKERGTMETLLICPASRLEIVLGKFFTVMLFSMSTALLNLLSMGMTGKYMVSIMSGGSGSLSQLSNLSLPTFSALCWVLVLLVPVAGLFSALSLSLATFARSSKEGQYYLTPLLIVTMGLTVFCLSPAIEISPFYSVMPVVGPTLLLKGLLSSAGTTWWYAIPVLITSIGYSFLALWWAIEQFSREDVLFRESERFDLRLWFQHLLRDKGPIPSFTEAGFLFITIMLLQFGTMKWLQDIIVQSTVAERGETMMRLLVVQQIAIIGLPAIIMAIFLTSNIWKTLRLRLPNWRYLLAGAVLPFVLHPLSLELAAVMQPFFPQLPPSVVAQFGMMGSSEVPLWAVLLVFALAPAVCEELAFRGFILSGFGESRRTGLAIVLSSLAFGAMHMIPQQVFNAALLGLVLGLLAVRSKSLLPGVLFHFLYNGLAVMHQRVGQEIDSNRLDDSLASWFVLMLDGALRYRWPLLVIAAGIAGVVILWLFNSGEITGEITGDRGEITGDQTVTKSES